MARLKDGRAVQPVQIDVPLEQHRLVKQLAAARGVNPRDIYQDLLAPQLNALRSNPPETDRAA